MHYFGIELVRKLENGSFYFQNSGVHIRSEYMYDMKDVWSKIQAVVRYLNCDKIT